MSRSSRRRSCSAPPGSPAITSGPAMWAFLLVVPGRASGATFVVNTPDDAVDVTPGDGICASAAGTCTLRAAVMEANELAGPDTITCDHGLDGVPIVLTIPPVDGCPDLGGGCYRDTDAAVGDLDISSELAVV